MLQPRPFLKAVTKIIDERTALLCFIGLSLFPADGSERPFRVIDNPAFTACQLPGPHNEPARGLRI